eukprot:SAG11_NODE_174_length_13505_cov_9.126585_3_plen_141_part_00
MCVDCGREGREGSGSAVGSDSGGREAARHAIGPQDAVPFLMLALGVTAVGLLAVMLFHIGTKEPPTPMRARRPSAAAAAAEGRGGSHTAAAASAPEVGRCGEEAEKGAVAAAAAAKESSCGRQFQYWCQKPEVLLTVLVR